MFKNIKRLATVGLPAFALIFTSCGTIAKVISYEQMRAFAKEQYDEHAIDTVPVNYIANFNSMNAHAIVDIITPTGEADQINLGFSHNGIHVKLKDRYAYFLSSIMIDNIERYYSNMVSFISDLDGNSPFELTYQLLEGNCSKIDITRSRENHGEFVVRLNKSITSLFDTISSVFGYIPSDPSEIQNAVLKTIVAYIISSPIGDFSEYLFGIFNYVQLNIFNSSRSFGDVFNTYITTDSNGMINKLDFNFKSNFVVNGLAAYKHYDSTTPSEGDRPELESPYHFTLTGSFDFDFDISTEYATK